MISSEEVGVALYAFNVYNCSPVPFLRRFIWHKVSIYNEKYSMTDFTSIETEWEYKGYRCVVVFHEKRWRCGYVGIPKTHACFGKHYDDIKVRVHGGLTYAGEHADGLYYFGFDCIHAGDRYADDISNSRSAGHFWTKVEAMVETDQLAEQLEDLDKRIKEKVIA